MDSPTWGLDFGETWNILADMERANVPSLLSKAAKISSKAAELADQGRLDEALDLETKADLLRGRAREVAAASGEVTAASRLARRLAVERKSERAEPARAVILAALAEVGVASAPRVIADYSFARFGTSVEPGALASLRRDEQRTWTSPRTDRAVYIVPALEGNRFFAARGKIARSDWSLERRIIGPWSERADHLRATINIARQLAWLSSRDDVAAQRVVRLLTSCTATVTGARGREGEIDPGRVDEAARAELAIIGGDDEAWRREAAKRAKKILTEEQQIWGAPLPSSVRRG
jgi:hypothetical protein